MEYTQPRDAEVRQLLSTKPVFQKFVEANAALLDCYAKIEPGTVSGMSLSQMDTQCTAEKDAIRRLLNSNEMTMTQVVKDRVDVLRAYQAANPGPVILKGQVVEVDKMPKFREG